MEYHLTTMGFVRADIFEVTARNLYEDSPTLTLPVRHYFAYQHYPIDKENNRAKLKNICDKYGIIWVDMDFDRGLHNGFNHLMSIIKPKPDDIVIGLDPDDRIETKGWDKAMVEATLDRPDRIPFITLNNHYGLNDSPGCIFRDELLGGHRAKVPTNRAICMNGLSFLVSWYNKIGGFNEPTTHYGHIESFLWGKLAQFNQELAVLVDYRYGPHHWEENASKLPSLPSHDPLYTQYKHAQASFQSRESFEEWLVKTGHGNLL